MTDAHVVGDMRQQHSRPAAELPAVVSDAVNKVAAGFRLSDAGVVGADAFLRADLLFEVGETLELRIELPGGGPLVARGRVLRIERGSASEPLTGMAIALVDLSASNRATLEAALR
jgi:hypothetical protein